MRILEQVDRRGPMAVADLHRRWPTTGHQIRMLVVDLARDQLLAPFRAGDSRLPLVAITDAGRALIAGGATDDP
jgi:hypothetical protein